MTNPAPIPPPQVRFYDNTMYLAHYCEGLICKAHDSGLTTIDPINVRLGVAWMESTYSSDEDKHLLIRNFIFYSYPYWEHIRLRQEQFFDKEIYKVFYEWDKSHVALFRDLFFVKKADGTLFISAEQKKTIWDTFNGMVKICIHYVHEMREPYTTTGGLIAYSKPDEFNHVMDLGNLIRTWDMTGKVRVKR